MKLRLKNHWSRFLFLLCYQHQLFTAHAAIDIEDTLPDMGTTAGSTLSINQEIAIGDYYTRQLRNSTISF